MSHTTLRTSMVVVTTIVVMLALVAGVGYARAQIRQSAAGGTVEGDFTIFDTPQATLLLDRSSGELWRVGYTEVSGHRYWFSTYVPREPATSFGEFQNRLRKEIRTAPRPEKR